ncbi:MAG: hypothetical protein ACKOQ4_13365 [Mycobacterium sp.]
MATDWHSHPGQPPRDDDEPPIRIRTCSRLGLSANPPGFGGWLRRR